MERTFLLLAGVYGFLAIALGAFGVHELKGYLENLPGAAERMAWWQTASQYHLAHTLAIGLAAYLAARTRSAAATAAGWCFAGGVLLFSGSLYVMTLTGTRALGAVTPLGGLLMLAGWAAVGVAALRVAKG